MKCVQSDEFARRFLGRDVPWEKSRAKCSTSTAVPSPSAIRSAQPAREPPDSLKELQRRKARRALVSLCVGGGQGAAVWLERN